MDALAICELIDRDEIAATQIAVRGMHDYLWGPLPHAKDPFYAELDQACVEATPKERMDFLMMSIGL